MKSRVVSNRARVVRRWFPVWAAAALALLSLGTGIEAPDSLATGTRSGRARAGSHVAIAPPSRMVWAWERALDLRFLGGDDVGVAFYASTLVVADDRAFVVRRRSPVLLDPRTYRMAVLRIEHAPGRHVTASPAVVDALATEARRLLALPRVSGIQLDFDARASERPTHAQLVAATRRVIPPQAFFSVTTLASHCFDDPMAGASVTAPDELVPMYFRMGADDAVVRRSLRREHAPRVERCRASAGVADDESRPSLAPVERAYLFLAGDANEASVRAALGTLPVIGAP